MSATATAQKPAEPTNSQMIDRMAEWMRILIDPGQVVELRALGVEERGYESDHGGFYDYDHLWKMASDAFRISRHAKGVYFTLNPLDPDLLARRAYLIKRARSGDLSSDSDVIRRHWLLVDADPKRKRDISSKDKEKRLAWETIQRVRDHLRAKAWPEPILADSGNGYHLMYRIDLPADDGGIVERCLKALAKEFDTPAVQIDQTVFNPSRICKFPGTWARKGTSIPERPHRQSRILEVPE